MCIINCGLLKKTFLIFSKQFSIIFPLKCFYKECLISHFKFNLKIKGNNLHLIIILHVKNNFILMHILCVNIKLLYISV